MFFCVNCICMLLPVYFVFLQSGLMIRTFHDYTLNNIYFGKKKKATSYIGSGKNH